MCAQGCDKAPEAAAAKAHVSTNEAVDSAVKPTTGEAEAKGSAPTNAEAKAPARAGRPAQDLARDARRKPQEVLDFFEVKAGDKVVELMAGRGYYSELIAARVGAQGKAWAHNSPFVLDRFAEAPITERLERLQAPQLARINSELDAPDLPGDLDAVLMILFYHDTYWQKVDRKAMLAAVHSALRPGGVFGVVDHHAKEGAGEQDVKRLHRVERQLVIDEVLAAGFVLDGESELLRNREDDRSGNVFFAGEDNRDMTDRFVLRFKKP